MRATAIAEHAERGTWMERTSSRDSVLERVQALQRGALLGVGDWRDCVPGHYRVAAERRDHAAASLVHYP